jgi:hypothetical protein
MKFKFNHRGWLVRNYAAEDGDPSVTLLEAKPLRPLPKGDRAQVVVQLDANCQVTPLDAMLARIASKRALEGDVRLSRALYGQEVFPFAEDANLLDQNPSDDHQISRQTRGYFGSTGQIGYPTLLSKWRQFALPGVTSLIFGSALIFVTHFDDSYEYLFRDLAILFGVAIALGLTSEGLKMAFRTGKGGVKSFAARTFLKGLAK